MPLDNWGTPLRDVLTDADIRLSVGDINEKLQAFLASDGDVYARPYETLIGKAGREIAPNRLETYKKLFEQLGLVFIADGRVQVSELGLVLTGGLAAARGRVRKENYRVGVAAAAVLGRYQLLNPTTINRDYPPDCDVLPYRVIWTCLLELGSLHWEELHRVLMRVMKSVDTPSAIETIAAARNDPDYDPQDALSAAKFLGPPVYDDEEQATRRITPWFSAAGFGGLLIEREPAKGVRALTEIGKQIVADALSEKVGWIEFGSDRQSWFDYLNKAVLNAKTHDGSKVAQQVPLVSKLSGDDRILQEVRKLLEEDKASGILFVGPPGTGKSWYARQIGIELTGGRREALREVQFHPAYQYEDFVEGYAPAPGGGFILADKHLLEMVEVAKNTDGQVVIVIDELTRTDPSRVMGEVLTYMERSLRETEFFLPSGRSTQLPSNLVFLATANLDDRSVDELDAAMERRWSKITLEPDPSQLAAFLRENGMNGPHVRNIVEFFRSIQDFMPLGHAYFRNVTNADTLERLWRRQFLPQLQRKFRYETERLAEAVEVWRVCSSKMREADGPVQATEDEK